MRKRLQTGEYRVKRKEAAKSQDRDNFCEVVRAVDDSSIGYVKCNSCDKLYKHESHKTGMSSTTRHVCAGSKRKDVSQSGITAFLKSNTIPTQVKSEVIDACVELCCQDLRPFVSGDGFCAVAQSLITVGACNGRVDASSALLHWQTICDRAKATAKRLIKLWIVALQLPLICGLMITTNGHTQHLPVASSVKTGN